MRKLQVTPNLRVSQAETRLTVYRLLDIPKLFSARQMGGKGLAPIGTLDPRKPTNEIKTDITMPKRFNQVLDSIIALLLS